MQCKLIKAPSEEELLLVKRAVWITMGRTDMPETLPSDALLHGLLNARHSPIRLLTFVFQFDDIPSNTSVHLCRHVHALPFVGSLRNDRQTRIDGDTARRDTPVPMLFAVNAEELMVIANKRLCNKAAPRTREAVQLMCDEAAKAFPVIAPFLEPMCEYHGGVCHELASCGKCVRE